MLCVTRLQPARLGRGAAVSALARYPALSGAPALLQSRGLASAAPVMTEQDVLAAQKKWSDGVVAIGKAYLEGGDYKGLATAAASTIYGYDYGKVLFKPTRCAEVPFRPTPSDALSYFVGGHYPEDTGFAIQPWSAISWHNHDIYTCGEIGIAMGEYKFTDAKTAAVTKVEYTFGYRKHPDGEVRIFLHHSSVPFKPA